ncbi:hypothetical protein EYF80_051398 [Liparis tanakae]|uniref:Uncharacterized protein n=1 Tax=Liparis tanakae TaxID=230148 RepID=A0A4Z2FDG7_9TELE|nr:hypothetical protein EYF80_051398 [Liparis tanakae]
MNLTAARPSPSCPRLSARPSVRPGCCPALTCRSDLYMFRCAVPHVDATGCSNADGGEGVGNESEI